LSMRYIETCERHDNNSAVKTTPYTISLQHRTVTRDEIIWEQLRIGELA